MTLMILHKGTGTVIPVDDCVLVQVPNNVEEADEWIRKNEPSAIIGTVTWKPTGDVEAIIQHPLPTKRFVHG